MLLVDLILFLVLFLASLGIILGRKFSTIFPLFLVLLFGWFFYHLKVTKGWKGFSSLTLEKFLNDFLNFLSSPPLFFVFLKIIFLIIAIFFLGFIIFALLKTTWLKHLILIDLKEFFTFRPSGIKKQTKKWKKIKERLEFDIESEWKLAVLEAFELLTKSLLEMGWRGKDFSELLNLLTEEEISNINELSKLYEIRQGIVYDPAYRLEKDVAEKVLKEIEKALTEIQFL